MSVIVGATGEPTRRKLILAIYNLALDNLLPPISRWSGIL
jgi:glucose-6-phosphate 1-dehydrogenase